MDPMRKNASDAAVAVLISLVLFSKNRAGSGSGQRRFVRFPDIPLAWRYFISSLSSSHRESSSICPARNPDRALDGLAIPGRSVGQRGPCPAMAAAGRRHVGLRQDFLVPRVMQSLPPRAKSRHACLVATNLIEILLPSWR